jgi:uncharacterized protein YdaU (DUF1376 family)
MNLEYWFPLRHQVKTEHLSCLEDGAYRRLIDRYMLYRQPLLDSDVVLARIAGLAADEWASIAATVRAFFVENGGKLAHTTCNEQLDAQDARARTRSESGQKAARARWVKSCEADTSRMRDAYDTDAGRNAEQMRENAIRQDKTEQNNPSTLNIEREVQEGEPSPAPVPSGEKRNRRKQRSRSRPETDSLELRKLAERNKRELAIEHIRKGIPCPWLTDKYVDGLFKEGVITLAQCRKAGFSVEAPR